MKTYHYQFKVVLAGIGANSDEAWQDVVEGFCQDPGSTPDESETEILEEYED